MKKVITENKKPNPNGYDLLVTQFINIFSEVIDRRESGIKKIDEQCRSYFDGKVIVYGLTFKKYLELQILN